MPPPVFKRGVLMSLEIIKGDIIKIKCMPL